MIPVYYAGNIWIISCCLVLDVDGVVLDFVSIEVLEVGTVLFCKNLSRMRCGRGEVAFHCRIHHVGLAGMDFLLGSACCVEKHLVNHVLDVETEYSRNRLTLKRTGARRLG